MQAEQVRDAKHHRRYDGRGAHNNISGNTQDGILISGNQNMVEGNYIGTDATGTQPQGNGIGVEILGSSSNTIGGTTAAARNIISGNAQDGILITYGDQNLVEGNFIGTNASGTRLPNGGDGVGLTGAGNNTGGNTIGGTTAGASNVISGNTGSGIPSPRQRGRPTRSWATSSAPTVWERRGWATSVMASIWWERGITPSVTRSAGRQAMPATSSRATREVEFVSPAARSTTRFWATSTIRSWATSLAPTVQTGTMLPNGGDGIDLVGAGNNTIGNTIGGLNQVNADGSVTRSARDVISGNTGSGIGLSVGAVSNQVLGNFIGTDATGTILPNGGDGVDLVGAGNNTIGNTIGGTTTGARNVISGNSGSGIRLTSSAVSQSRSLGNFIGTDATGQDCTTQPGVDGVDLMGAGSNEHRRCHHDRRTQPGEPRTAPSRSSRPATSSRAASRKRDQSAPPGRSTIRSRVDFIGTDVTTRLPSRMTAPWRRSCGASQQHWQHDRRDDNWCPQRHLGQLGKRDQSQRRGGQQPDRG